MSARSQAAVVATGTSDVQGVEDACTLHGYSVRETAGSPAVATLVLRDGEDANGTLVAVIELAASGSETVTLPAVRVNGGVFVERIAGEAEIVLYYSR